MTDSELADGRARTSAVQQGQIVRAAHLALLAAGEPAPEFEYLTSSVGDGGETYVRLSKSERGHRGPSDLRPGDRLYTLLADKTGVYERRSTSECIVVHRSLRFDGTVELLAESPFR